MKVKKEYFSFLNIYTTITGLYSNSKNVYLFLSLKHDKFLQL